MIRQRGRTRSKYGARKVVIDGITFDSQREGDRYSELKILERAGEITDLKLQQRYELIPKRGKERPVYYTADFSYRRKDGTEVVEDVKGFRTRDYIIRRKLMNWRYGIEIQEV